MATASSPDTAAAVRSGAASAVVAAESGSGLAASLARKNPLRYRSLDQWLGGYLKSRRQRPQLDDGQPYHVFLSVCDHYEPEFGQASEAVALERVDAWCERYPRLFSQFADADGRPPQQTFFFPQDQYRPVYLDRLAELCGDGFGDVEVHLHHHDDTEANLTERLDRFRHDLHERHGLLRLDPDSGEPIYGFIHGNWALANSRRDGCYCGVDNELEILQRTGCYADFSMPSAPVETQTRLVNQIFYAANDPTVRKPYDEGIEAAVGQTPPDDHLLMVAGPLGPDWNSRKLGVIPRIENSDLHAFQMPTVERFENWCRIGVHVAGRPDWIFIKLHTHGCKPVNLDAWFSDATVQFHADLARLQADRPEMKLHYVTAWETAQLVHAAERGDPVESVLSASAASPIPVA